MPCRFYFYSSVIVSEVGAGDISSSSFIQGFICRESLVIPQEAKTEDYPFKFCEELCWNFVESGDCFWEGGQPFLWYQFYWLRAWGTFPSSENVFNVCLRCLNIFLSCETFNLLFELPQERVFKATVKGIVCLISFLVCQLYLCGLLTFALISYPDTLLKVFISCGMFLVGFLGPLMSSLLSSLQIKMLWLPPRLFVSLGLH